MLIAGLIYHPEMGLILFECGSTEDIDAVGTSPLTSSLALFFFSDFNWLTKNPQQWSSEATDLFPRTCYTQSHHLPEAIKAAGYDIKDVQAVIMGHLHLDHAGGLEHFRNTNVPIYVHEEEFKHACWAAGTNSDGGLYLWVLIPGQTLCYINLASDI